MGLTAKQRKAAVLIADGSMTYQQVADEVNIHISNLNKWRKKPDFIAELRKCADELLASRIHLLNNTLFKEAEKGNYQHLRLAYERIDRIYGENPQDDHQVTISFRKED